MMRFRLPERGVWATMRLSYIERHPMSQSIITVIGKDRIGIVYDIAKLLAENQINILNISQQLMGGYFTMIILADVSQSRKTPPQMAEVFRQASEELHLTVQIQHEEIFNAMHRI